MKLFYSLDGNELIKASMSGEFLDVCAIGTMSSFILICKMIKLIFKSCIWGFHSYWSVNLHDDPLRTLYEF